MKIIKWLFVNKNEDAEQIESQENNFEILKHEIEPEAICPYCKTALMKFPLRKTKCFNCGKSIYILKFNNYTEKKLVTEEEKNSYEFEQKRISFRDRWLSELKTFGVKEDTFYTRKKELFLKSGIENNDNDVIWSLFNDLLIKNSNNDHAQSNLYLSMAIYLFREGKPFDYLLREKCKADLKRMHLESLESRFVSVVEIIASSDGHSPACGKCQKLDGVQLTFEDALLKMPIPLKDCEITNGFHRCFYGAIPMRDSEGMLVLKK